MKTEEQKASIVAAAECWKMARDALLLRPVNDPKYRYYLNLLSEAEDMLNREMTKYYE